MNLRETDLKLASKNGASNTYFDWHWLGRNRTTYALLLTLLAALLAYGTGLSQRTDEQFRVSREGILSREASGDIHILEIDAKSISAINSWPWPRAIHGQIVDKLSAAGVETIAFDVDFSSPSQPDQDRIFAEALRQFSGTVILPTFVQPTEADGSELFENLPIEQLRSNAFLASVNVKPDRDGAIRNIGYGTVTEGLARPTMAAVLANASGNIEQQFRIDTSINPASIPRHSVIDLLHGRIPTSSLRGKSIFIGATAIELGDRYAMPRHGVQPGVVIQALAAETLIHRDDFRTISALVSIGIASIIAFVAIRSRHLRGSVLAGLGGTSALWLLPLGLEYLTFATIDVATAIYALVATVMVCVVADVLGRFNHLRLVDADTGFSNGRAMGNDLLTSPANFVVVMQIQNFSDITAVLNEQEQTQLIDNIGQALSLGSGASVIYGLGKGSFGWLSHLDDANELVESIDGLHALLTARVATEQNKVVATACFGVASTTQDKECDVIGNATLAAHQAQVAGTKWAVYSEAMSDRNGYVQQVLAGLEEAMDSDDIYLLFQPKWSLKNDCFIGVEALVRWNHAILGPISPADFIPVLEQNNLMSRVTMHISKLCGEMALEWDRIGLDLSIAINISAPLLSDKQFAETLGTYFKALLLKPGRITLEVTESAAVPNDEPIIASLEYFRQIGIAISIDDYGTGQSTLSYLQKFPADEIKIDQSFIRSLVHNRSDQILVRSTIELGHELGLKVIAEGVENEETMALLREYNCDAVQGWHVGKPKNRTELAQLIAGCFKDQSQNLAVG